MSANPLFDHMVTALDVIFGEQRPDPAALESALPEDSPLALPERTSLTLSNGDVVRFDLYQISADCWSAKNADHDAQCGWGETSELAIRDLEQFCEDDLRDWEVML